MKMDQSFAVPISRRSFMKLMGLAAAETVLGAKGEVVKAAAASSPAPTVDFAAVGCP